MMNIMTPLLTLHAAIAAALLGADSDSIANGVEPPAIRVVVQNPMLGTVLDRHDGFLLVRAADRFLELHDADSTRLRWVLEFPRRIGHAVLGPNAKWCLVAIDKRDSFSEASEGEIFRVDLESGARSMFLRGVSGMMALDDDATRVAILDIKGEIGARTSELGAWALATGDRLALTASQISPPSAAPAWDGDIVHAEGPDHRIRYVRVQGNRWLTSLNAATGESAEAKGPESETWSGVWMSPALGQQVKSLADHTQALAKMWEGRVTAHVPLSLVENADGALIASVNAGRRTLRVLPDGAIEFGEDKAVDNLRRPLFPVANRLIGERSSPQPHMYDAAAHKPLALIPTPPLNNPLTVRYLPKGWVVVAGITVYYFIPDELEPLWKTVRHFPAPTASEKQVFLRTFAGSADGSLIAMCSDPSLHMLEVRNTKSGDVVMTLPPLIADGRSQITAAIDAASSLLAVSIGDEMKVYAIPAGTIVAECRHDKEEHIWRVLPLDGGWWVVRGTSGVHVLDAKLHRRAKLEIDYPASVQWIGSENEREILLNSDSGVSSIVNILTGDVRWRSSNPPSSYSVGADVPRRAATIFGGRVLAHDSGHGESIELLSVPTLESIVRIRIVPLSKHDVGWVAWTPDGFWSASPGAETFVEIFEDDAMMTREATAQRHRPELIRERIAAQARGASNGLK